MESELRPFAYGSEQTLVYSLTTLRVPTRHFTRCGIAVRATGPGSVCSQSLLLAPCSRQGVRVTEKRTWWSSRVSPHYRGMQKRPTLTRKSHSSCRLDEFNGPTKPTWPGMIQVEVDGERMAEFTPPASRGCATPWENNKRR